MDRRRNPGIIAGCRLEPLPVEQRFRQIRDRLLQKLSAEADRMQDKIPYIAEHGVYETDMAATDPAWWTNGFWAGMMWQLYHVTGEERFLQEALPTEKTLDQAMEAFDRLHHDVGFMWMHSFVAHYRQTGDDRSRIKGLHAANLLLGRYNANGRFIRAWDKDVPGWMIIDCLMNLPLLYWASEETGDPRFLAAAVNHADTALGVLMRADGSCHHIGSLNPENGEVLGFPKGQGFAENSSWSRGQAWALYGFAISYLHTKRQEYLDAAKRSAHYFISNIALTGFVSLSDFRAPEEPVIWDTTASACAASGLLLIASLVPEHEKKLYRLPAENILLALNQNHCDWDPGRDGILQNGTAAYGREADMHKPIIYGDYFLLEAVLRLGGEELFLW